MVRGALLFIPSHSGQVIAIEAARGHLLHAHAGATWLGSEVPYNADFSPGTKERKIMQHTFNSFIWDGRYRLVSQMGLAGALLLLLFAIGLPTMAQSEGAQLRLGHFVFDGPSVNLYVDDAVVADQNGTAALYYSMTLPSTYRALTAGAHTFALTAEGESLDSAIVSEQEFTLEAEHRYLLALLGNVTTDDLHLALIDETAAIAEQDITRSAVTIMINNLTGIAALDMLFAGQPFLTNLAYGDFAVTQDPTEGSGTLITAHDNPDTVIMEFPEAVGSPAHFFAAFVFSGAYSGTLWDGYTALYTGQYEGELTITDGGVITVGDALPVEFTDMGQRVRFTLVLDAPAVLDIIQSGEAGFDAFVRLYDAAGNVLRENDELSMDDNADGIFDAGWTGLSLDAGTYVIEAGTYTDTGVGSFTVAVSEATS
jgi:hypothetical protein